MANFFYIMFLAKDSEDFSMFFNLYPDSYTIVKPTFSLSNDARIAS